MDYLDFVEEYKTQKEITLFEKILVATERAKDLTEGRAPKMEESEPHKPTTVAIYEITQKLIDPEIHEITDDEMDDYNLADLDDDDDEDED